MKSASLKKRLSAISRLYERQKYDEALAEVDRLLDQWPGNSHLYVLKGILIQLQENGEHELAEAKKALELATELDPDCPHAWIELGHFLNNVEDDPSGAAKAYTRGIEAARNLLLDGLIGQANVFRQLGRDEDFKQHLLEILLLDYFGAMSGETNLNRHQTELLLAQNATRIQALHLNGGTLLSVLATRAKKQRRGPWAEQIEDLLREFTTSVGSSD